MNINKIFAILVVLLLSSTNLLAGDNKVENIKPDIIGKTFLFDYGSYAYDTVIPGDRVTR